MVQVTWIALCKMNDARQEKERPLRQDAEGSLFLCGLFRGWRRLLHSHSLASAFRRAKACKYQLHPSPPPPPHPLSSLRPPRKPGHLLIGSGPFPPSTWKSLEQSHTSTAGVLRTFKENHSGCLSISAQAQGAGLHLEMTLPQTRGEVDARLKCQGLGSEDTVEPWGWDGDYWQQAPRRKEQRQRLHDPRDGAPGWSLLGAWHHALSSIWLSCVL